MNRRSFIASVVAVLTAGCATKSIQLVEVPPVVEPPLVPVSIWAYRTGLIHDTPFDGGITIYSEDEQKFTHYDFAPPDEYGAVHAWLKPGKYTVWAGEVGNGGERILAEKSWTIRQTDWHQFINLVVE